MSLLWSLFSGSSSSQQLWDSAKFSIIKNITITEVAIGRGSYGVIYDAIYGGKECVAKEIHANLMVEGIGTNTVVESFIKEVNVLSTLRHPSIVNFIGVHFREGSRVPILIIEKMWTSLAAFVSERSSVPHIIKVHILKDVACGLNYLHSQEPPILHRDLTANNILLSTNLDAKIADLGLAKALETITTQRMSTVPGTLAYMPPEAIQKNPVYTTKLDVFSFGCVILHTVTQEFPSPTDQFEASTLVDDVFLKISEYKRRGKYFKVMESYPHLSYLASSCLKDDPEYRPDATRVFTWIEEYCLKPEIKQHCSGSLLDYSKSDKFSLILSLDAQSTKTEELESTVKLYQSQVHELTSSAVAKEAEITSLQRSNNEQLVSIQSQQLEIDQLKSQNDKLQQDMSQQSDSDIVMSLSTILRQEQVDMTEKQEEIKNLKVKLNNMEKSYNSLKKESEEKEQNSQQEDSQLKAYLKKEAELIQNVEALSNQKECLVREKEELNQQMQNYFASLQSNQQEIKKLKSKLEQAEQNSSTSESTRIDKQSVYMEQSVNSDNPSNESIVHHKEKGFQDQVQNMSAHMRKMQKENEDLKYKLKKEEEMKQKLKEEAEQKVKEELDYWKSKAESAATTDKDRARNLETEKQKLEEEKEKLKEKLLATNKLGNNHLAEFNKNIKDIQVANENYTQKVKQVHQCLATLEKQKKEISELKQKLSNVKSMNRVQLDEKSLRLSLLQPQLSACQQKLEVKDKELSDLQSQNENLQKLLENTSKLHTAAQKELESYKAAHKEELNTSKEVQSNVDALLQADLQKCQDLIREKENEIAMLNENLQKYHETNLQLQRRIKELEKENKKLITSLNKSSRQLESKLKDKAKYIQSLEKKSSVGQYDYYHYSLHWSPYLSLPVRKIKPSAAVVKDKVFVTGGYQDFSPQGKELNSYIKSLERGNEVFCFHTTKCRCDSITSPVVLGGVASVNGQCVLVSGAEGSTLTGNVYVLCEEGSDEQWKKFSETVRTPRILPCVCCYGERWMIVCGGYTCKEGSNLLEAVNVVEILDTTKGEWYTLPEAGIPNLSTILACNVVGDDVYITGDDKVLKNDCSKLISVITASSDNALWTEVPVVVEERDEDLHPFSIVEVNGEPMIIASISGSEDDATCVLIKDTTDTWRKMSEVVECQHCSAVVVTPTLELLLFGGSEKVSSNMATNISQCGTLIPTLAFYDHLPVIKRPSSDSFSGGNSFAGEELLIFEENVSKADVDTPADLSFTGPIHTKQFDHKGGTFQSPIHKVSIVVPPNAIDDGEKVTVYMGATTSGPFDLPEDCKLRSAVVWLGSGSDVVLKKSIIVVVPHSAVFTSPQHHSMMRFLVCEDCEGPRYKFGYLMDNYEIDNKQGCIWFELNKSVLMAVAASSNCKVEDAESDDEFYEASEDVSTSNGAKSPVLTRKAHHQEWSSVGEIPKIPPVRYLAKLLWPCGPLPNSFRADIFYLCNIPTELYKVNTLYRKAYYEDNGAYPEIVETEFMVDGDGTELKCVLPCSGSSECDCLSGWSVTQMNDISEVQIEKDISQYKCESMKLSFKFTCLQPKADLTCCFAFEGVKRLARGITDLVPFCIRKKYGISYDSIPFIVEQGIYDGAKGNNS